MGIYSHFFVVRLGDLSKGEHKVEMIDSENTPIQQIMKN